MVFKLHIAYRSSLPSFSSLKCVFFFIRSLSFYFLFQLFVSFFSAFLFSVIAFFFLLSLVSSSNTSKVSYTSCCYVPEVYLKTSILNISRLGVSWNSLLKIDAGIKLTSICFYYSLSRSRFLIREKTRGFKRLFSIFSGNVRLSNITV